MAMAFSSFALAGSVTVNVPTWVIAGVHLKTPVLASKLAPPGRAAAVNLSIRQLQ